MTKPSSSKNISSTPVTNNYAEPHTPIASAKRPRNPPRSSLSGTRLNSTPPPAGSSLQNTSIISTPNVSKTTATPGGSSYNLPVSSLSPMHPARPMHSHYGYEQTERVNRDSNEESNVNEVDETSTSVTWGALFSPVLSFLGQPQLPTAGSSSKEQDPLRTNQQVQDKDNSNLDDVIYDDDGDVSMCMNEEMDTKLHQMNSPSVTDSNTEAQDHLSSSQLQLQQQNQQQSSTQIQRHQPSSGESCVVEESSDAEDDFNEYDDDSSEVEEEFNPYLFIKRLPIYSTVAPFDLQVHLPPKEKDDPPLTLVLDLDETLVHCTVEPNTPNVDMVFPVVFHGMEYQVQVKKRPYLEEFLERVYKEFEVVVFTASQRVYADELLDRIDPEKKYIKHRMFRESCLPVEGNYLKDLNVLGRDLSAAVLVDNSPHAFGYQIDNGIPIESWFDDPHDTELLKLEQFLRTLKGAQDVRPLVRAKFQTHRLINEA